MTTPQNTIDRRNDLVPRQLEELATLTGPSSRKDAHIPLLNALDVARSNGYSADGLLTAAVDALANGARLSGWAIEDAVDVARAAIQRIAPSSAERTGERASVAWTEYFRLYDALIQQVVRTFVIGGMTPEIVPA